MFIIFCLIIVVVLFIVGLENVFMVLTSIVCIFCDSNFFVITLKKVFVLIFL